MTELTEMTGTAGPTVLTRLKEWLAEEGIVFTEKVHEPTYTSEESAAQRGEPLRIGGKALLMKADDRFVLLVLPADRKIVSSAARKALRAKSTRFATKEELFALTGLVPGSVPPFGRPIFELELLADEALLENDRIAFNAGSLTHSFILSMPDYLAAAKPSRAAFTEPAAS